MILKNVCSIESMQEMTDAFNEDECVENIYKILGLEEKNYLPHYVTINECLAKLENEQLEILRKKMICSLIRKNSFNGGKFLGRKWLVIIDATHLFSFRSRHCKHCLSKTINKGTEEEKTIYYHPVLEAKIVLDDKPLQLYRNGIRDVKIVHRTLVKISEGLLECLKKQELTKEVLEYKRMQIRKTQ